MTKFNEFIVGVVFFLAMGILGYYTIVRGELFDTREFVYGTIIFEDVEGLAIGDKTLVNGVESGTVTAIELMADGKVIVSFKLFRFFNLYENYKIILKNQSALGGRIILINPGAAEVNGEVFETVDSLKNLTGITIGDPLTKISEVIDENREDLRTAIKNISEFSAKINKGEGTIAKLVNEDTLHKDADQLIKELRDTVEDSREQAPVTSFIRAALTAF
ncbi:MAG TPA: MlaD family protein [Spirochaetota bacterium]|nr:MlaD family protein [Spirochaetota bacterium]HPS86588.1 MlaD family protein [Spirochaetota bacterium]